MGPLQEEHVDPIAMRAGRSEIDVPGVVAKTHAAEIVGADLMHESQFAKMRVMDLPVTETVALPTPTGCQRGVRAQLEEP